MNLPKPKTMPAKKTTAAGSKRSKILLVDDHPLMRRGQADLLEREADLTVCGEAGTARTAMDAIAKLQPDLVVVDMALPDKDGLELIKDIQAFIPACRCWLCPCKTNHFMPHGFCGRAGGAT